MGATSSVAARNVSQPAAVPVVEADTKALFTRLDTDKSGKLSTAELQQAIRANGMASEWPDERLKYVLAEMDVDGDGQLSAEEFDAALTRLKEGSPLCRRSWPTHGPWWQS